MKAHESNAEIQRSRTLSDAKKIERGAQYVAEGKSPHPRLEFTSEQVKQAEKKMSMDLEERRRGTLRVMEKFLEDYEDHFTKVREEHQEKHEKNCYTSEDEAKWWFHTAKPRLLEAPGVVKVDISFTIKSDWDGREHMASYYIFKNKGQLQVLEIEELDHGDYGMEARLQLTDPGDDSEKKVALVKNKLSQQLEDIESFSK